MRRTAACVLASLVAGACGSSPSSSPAADAGVESGQPAIWLRPSTSIDPTKLPLCDQCYTAVTGGGGPKKGYAFVCDAMAYQQTNGPGGVGGPWIDAAGHTYDVTRKPFWRGDVHWDQAEISIAATGDPRGVAGNGLPFGVPTGLFPVSSSDPAFQYDRNPNSITPQSISFSIPGNPTIDPNGPHCTYKRVGITLDGVQMHGPIDSSGRDELAWQIQDACTGDAQPGGGYHRHALGECVPHIHENNSLVGYALDGFGIFSPYDAAGKELVSADLDECHGTTSPIPWEGQTVTMYHYVLTRDFPYTVACFRGMPTRNAFPPLPGAPVEQAY
ncbi:MAG TPA: YHYH protein [Polyangiaceae bacterium]